MGTSACGWDRCNRQGCRASHSREHARAQEAHLRKESSSTALGPKQRGQYFNITETGVANTCVECVLLVTRCRACLHLVTRSLHLHTSCCKLSQNYSNSTLKCTMKLSSQTLTAMYGPVCQGRPRTGGCKAVCNWAALTSPHRHLACGLADVRHSQ